MKLNIFKRSSNFYLHFILLSLPCCVLRAQIGVNTNQANSTLDISKISINNSTAKDGILIPKITKAKLADKIVGTYGINQISTLVYVDNVTNLPLTNLSANQVTNINNTGFYFFDSDLIWKPLNTQQTVVPIERNNIYLNDGNITDNRIVNQGNKYLFFKGNNFIVRNNNDNLNNDNVNLYVDNLTNTVGVGTVIPSTKLHIKDRLDRSGIYDPVPIFQLTDGTQSDKYVLTSDSEGNATWKPNPYRQAVLSPKANYTSNLSINEGVIIDKSVITLTKGKWIVNLAQLIYTKNPATTTNNALVSISLTSYKTSIYQVGFNFLDDNISIAGWLSPTTINNIGYSLIKGLIFIEITSDSPVNLYPYISSIKGASAYNVSSIDPYIANDENSYFYATSMKQL